MLFRRNTGLRNFIIVILTLLFSNNTKATHIYGADLFYTHVSGNTYTITMNIYGDCSAAIFSSLIGASPSVTVFNNTTTYTTISLTAHSPTSGTEVTPVCPSQLSNTACNSGSLPGVKKFVYSANVTLNTTSTNWRFRFNGALGTSGAGRSSQLTNISGPGSSTMNLEATLNNTNGSNSSPVYTTIPTPFFCINKSASYNPGTIDPNSDSLSYSLVPGLESSGTVTYLSGYSATSPIAFASGTFSYNTTNGQLNFTPNIVQQSLVVNRVSEYKNGVLVGTSMREMTFVVLNNCNNNPPGGKISNAGFGKIDTSGVEIAACKSNGTLTFNINPTDPDNDKINMSVSGLPAGGTVNISNNNTTAPSGGFSWYLPSVSPGTYTFFVTYVDEGCPLSSKQTLAYTIKVLPSPTLAFSLDTLATCTKKAIFTMTPSVSPSPWRIQIFQGSTQLHNFNGVTSAQKDSLSPGTYTLRVTNADTCFKDTVIVIPAPPAISINLGVTPLVCHNDADAKVVVIAGGGKPGFTYAINAGAFSSVDTFKNLSAGFFTFKVRDQNECQKDTIIFIANPLKINADVSFVQPPCNYYNSGVITVNAKNGKTPYLYALDAGSFSPTNTFTGLFSGTYALHVRDSNNCKLDSNVVLPDSVKVQATASITNILCFADSTGVIAMNASGATPPYRYKLDAGPLTPANTFNNLPAKTYSIHVEDTNKCYFDTSITLTQPTRINSTSTVTNVKCHNDATGAITVNGQGGISPYTYAIGSGSYGSNNTFGTLTAGTHTIRIKDANNCLRDTTITITQPADFVFQSVAITEPTCFSGVNGQIKVTSAGGVTPHTYAIGTGAFGTGSTFSSLGAGTYVLHIKDSNDCTEDSTVTIGQPTRVVPSASVKRSTCSPLNNGMVILGATGGIGPYTFAKGTGSFGSNNTFPSLAAGPYTMRVRDNNGCTIDTNINVADSLVIKPNISISNALCKDSSSGSISASPTGGVSPYTFALNTGSYGSTPVFGGLKANTYTFKIKDDIGCRKDTSVTVNEPLLLVPLVTITPPSCNGYRDGNLTINAVGGTPSYTFSVNGSPFVSGNSFGNINAGPQQVSIMDQNSCRRDTSVTVTQPPGMSFTLAITPVLCNGDSSGTVQVNGTGGTPGYTYTYDQKTFSGNSLLTGLKAGARVVKMRDSKNCIKDTNIMITEPAPLFITNPVLTHPTCEGFADGSIKVYGNGGKQPYEFSIGGGAFSSSSLFASQKEGAYNVRIRDANNCTYDTLLTLKGYPHIIIDSIPVTPVTCFGLNNGAVAIYASGGIQPLKYAKQGGAPSAANLFAELPAGTHKFNVIDDSGCRKDISIDITEPEKLVVGVNARPNDCEGLDNGGGAEAFVQGGTQPYSYEWNTDPVQYGYSINNIGNGAYRVVVTDANKCIDSAIAKVVYDDCCIVFVPDAFTPNKDGINDLARARVKGDFKLEVFAIYNRFGQKVFETNDLDDGWNGIFNASLQDLGTYNYYLKGICGNGGTREVLKKGTITLIR